MKTRETIKTRAPVRFDFSGGPSDVAPFKYKEVGQVFNTALKMYATAIIEPHPGNIVRIKSEDLNESEQVDLEQEIKLSGSLKLIKAAIAYLSPKKGFEIKTSVDTPLGSGLGSSAALAVACIAAIREFNGENIDDKRGLAEDALYLENVLLDNINGGQDQYAAALGGFNFFEFSGDDIKVDRINLPDSAVQELEERSFFCYSGESRLSGNVLLEIMKHYNAGDLATTNAIHNIRTLALEMNNALRQCRFSEYEIAIEQAFINQRSLHPQIVTPAIENIASITKSFGIKSIKIAGAGGGGCVYVFTNSKSFALQNELNKKGYLILPFRAETNGASRIE